MFNRTICTQKKNATQFVNTSKFQTGGCQYDLWGIVCSYVFKHETTRFVTNITAHDHTNTIKHKAEINLHRQICLLQRFSKCYKRFYRTLTENICKNRRSISFIKNTETLRVQWVLHVRFEKAIYKPTHQPIQNKNKTVCCNSKDNDIALQLINT